MKNKSEAKIITFLKSGYGKLLLSMFFTLFAVFTMLLVDKENNFLVGIPDDNFILVVLSWFKIESYNIQTNTYLLFFSLLGVFWVMVIMSLFAKPAKRKFLKLEEGQKATVGQSFLFWLLYYGVGLLISAALIFIAYLIGAYGNWQKDLGFVFVNVFLTLIVCLAMFAILVIALVAAYYIIKFIFMFLGWLFVQIIKMILKNEEYKELKDENPSVVYGAGGGGGGGGGDVNMPDKIVISGVDDDPNMLLKEKMFPSLSLMDKQWAEKQAEEERLAEEEAQAKAQAEADALAEEQAKEQAEADVDTSEQTITDVATEEASVEVEIEGEVEEKAEEETSETIEDVEAEETLPDVVEEEKEKLTLDKFVLRFQSYLCQNYKLYYELPLLRSFLGALAASRLIILEGLSGTGKSMLPRMFGEFVGSKTFFCPVQATWKDRTDIVGYYSDFTKEFKETEFLKRLYEFCYKEDQFNLMVLDEMNISRIEYYFADFLSTLEYPPSDWLIKLMQVKDGQIMPNKLVNGNVRIPENTWFIGTANTDDSTFTITDKVYDRAIIIDFKEKHMPITTTECSDPYPITTDELVALMEEAKANPEYSLTEAENAKFLSLCDMVLELFEIRFGNRILTQIHTFLPVYVAAGGTKEEAIDFMFARKVMRKLEGKYDEYIKDGILKLQKLIHKQYGAKVFKETEAYMAKLLKKFF